jgi:hypothetical protein
LSEVSVFGSVDDALAVDGFLVFIAVSFDGTTPNTSSTTARSVYDLVAFLLGYREEVFRELLRKAVDVLLAPGRGTPGSIGQPPDMA